MIIETHVVDRKALAKAIADELGSSSRYMGMPSCGYQVGAYTIDRNGNIIGEDFRPLQDFLLRNSYITEPLANANPLADSESQTGSSDEPERMYISVPAPDMTVVQLRNLVYLLYSKQVLISKMTRSEFLNVSDILIERLKEHLPETMEEFIELLDDARALGDLDGFDFHDGKLTMYFSFAPTEPERWTTYAGLISRLLKAAKGAHFFIANKKEAENEKYLARAFLLRLGYVGNDAKAERHLLLDHLSGSSAFPTEEAARKHSEKYAAIRAEQKLAKTEGSIKEVMSDD